MLEVPRANEPGTVTIRPSQLIAVDGAVLRVESVDLRTKKIVLGVVNHDIARSFLGPKQAVTDKPQMLGQGHEAPVPTPPPAPQAPAPGPIEAPQADSEAPRPEPSDME